MAIAFVQSKSVQTSGATSITTPSFASTAGHFLTAVGANTTGVMTGTLVSDNASNTWQNAWHTNPGGAASFYAENISANASHTVTYTPNGGSQACALAVAEFSGIASISSLDVTAVGPTNGFASVAPRLTNFTSTTTVSDVLLIGGGQANHGVGSSTAPIPCSIGKFTDAVVIAGNITEGLLASYAFVTATGAQTFSFKYDGGTDTEAVGVASFKATSPAFVQSKSVASTGATSITTPSFTSTAGNFLSALGTAFTKTFSGSPISDNKSSTWQAAWARASGGQYYAENIPGGSGQTVTLTVPGGSDFCALAVMEFSGVNTSSSLDKTTSASSSATPKTSGATSATTQASELVIGGASQSHRNSIAFSTIPDLWTDVEALADDTPEGVILAYRIVSAIGTYQYGYSDADAHFSAVGIAAYKAQPTGSAVAVAGQASLSIVSNAPSSGVVSVSGSSTVGASAGRIASASGSASVSVVGAVNTPAVVSSHGTTATSIGGQSLGTFFGPSSIVFWQVKSVQSNSATSITTPGMDTTPGHLLAASAGAYNFIDFGTGALLSLADSYSNTWDPVWNTSKVYSTGALFAALNCLGGLGHTFTLTPRVAGVARPCALAVGEWSGVVAKGSTSNDFTEPRGSGPIVTNQAYSLLLGGASSSHNATSVPPISVGFFTDIALSDSSAQGVIFSYAIVKKMDEYKYIFSSGSALNEASGIATFRGKTVKKPIKFVQSKTVQSGSATSITTPGITLTSGNFLVAIASAYSRSLTGSPISDSRSNTWQNAWVQNGGTNGHAGCYYAENIRGGTSSITLTVPGGSDSCALAIGEFSGIIGIASLDVTASAASGAVDPHDSGTASRTSQDQELIIGGGSGSHGGPDTGLGDPTIPYSTIPGNTFIDVAALAAATGEGILLSYRVVNSIDSYEYSYSNGSIFPEVRGIAEFDSEDLTIPGGGGVPGSTDPTVGDSMCGSTVPLFYCELQKDSGYLSYSWIDQPMNDPSIQRRPQIVEMSSLRRELSDWNGRVVINSGSITLTDYDSAIRAMIDANTIVRKQIDFYMIDEVRFRASGVPFRVGQYLITSYKLGSDMTVQLAFEDRFGGDSVRDLLSKPLPFRTLDSSFNPNLPNALAGKGEPVMYGILSDDTVGYPVVQVWYTGDRTMPDSSTWYEGFIAGCATSGPISVWGWDGENTDLEGNPKQLRLSPALYDTDIAMPGQGSIWAGFFGSTNYRVINGRRYTVMYFRHDSDVGEAFKLFSTSNGTDGVPVHVNLGGIEDIGNGSGSVITSVARQWQHLITNFVEQNHDTDANWYDIPRTSNTAPYSIIDAVSVEDTRLRAANNRVPGGYNGQFIINFDLSRSPLGDWFQRICLGGDMDMGIDRQGRMFLSMEDPTQSPMKAFTIVNILESSYQPSEKDQSKLANMISSDKMKNMMQTNQSVVLRPSATRDSPPNAIWLTAIRSVDDSTSINALGGDPVGRKEFHFENWVASCDYFQLLTDSVHEHKLNRMKDGPDFHTIETDLCGLDVDLGKLFSITHYAGLVATTRKIRCTAITLIPPDPFKKTWSVQLYGYDVTDLVF